MQAKRMVWWILWGKVVDISRAEWGLGGTVRLQCGTAGIFRSLAKLFLDPKQLIVLRRAVRTRQAARLDLPARQRHREIGNRRILGLARTMRHYRRIVAGLSQTHGIDRLGQRSDLVDLDEDRIGDPIGDALLEPLHVGDEQIVANQLHSAAELL